MIDRFVPRMWKALFFLLPISYGLCYAPYGINETDGGFITGLAWQLKQGGTLYRDVLYVRPPLPVWLRLLELHLWPENWAILAERWMFYAKVALYAWLSAHFLGQAQRAWPLACFAFVVSAHCYPAASWHTVDGILFAVLGFWVAEKRGILALIAGGLCMAASLLCKQSFYPLALLFPLYILLRKDIDLKACFWAITGLGLGLSAFACSLMYAGTAAAYFKLTGGGSSDSGQAFVHGVLDYFRITPELSLPSLAVLLPLAWQFWKKNPKPWAKYALAAWFLALALSFAAMCLLRQEHTVPFAQSRMMFWVAAAFALISAAARDLKPLAMLGVSWCAAISWGYNLPILFATPLCWAGFQLWDQLRLKPLPSLSALYLLLLLGVFRAGYAFVYRDGKRRDMNARLNKIYPRLSGIQTDTLSYARYKNLKNLQERYGSNTTVLPSFPLADYLARQKPVLPLDWVVKRELNGSETLVYQVLQQQKPIVFLEKTYNLQKIKSDPQLEISRYCWEKGHVVEETAHFYVIRLGGE